MVRGGIMGGCALLLALAAGTTRAQNYPTRAGRLPVPFAAGGSADIYGRFLAAKLSEATGEPFVIENRPGGGAVVGTDAVAKSAPDGYTVLIMSNTHTVNETLIPKKPYDLLRDLAPVTGINYQDLLLVAAPGVKANNLREFIAEAKAQPGKLNYASSGPGTPYHMAGELFKSMTHTDIVHIPHKASGEMRSSVLGGHVQMTFDAVTTMTENVKAGQVRALGTTANKRSKVMPDVPT